MINSKDRQPLRFRECETIKEATLLAPPLFYPTYFSSPDAGMTHADGWGAKPILG
jgi:hypothetical protein